MNKDILIKGAAIAIIGGLVVKNILVKSKERALGDAEYEDLGCEDVKDAE